MESQGRTVPETVPARTATTSPNPASEAATSETGTAAGTEASTYASSVPQPGIEPKNTLATRQRPSHHHRDHRQQSSLSAACPPPAVSSVRPRGGERPPNPLLLLIYNLLAADTFLSATYLHNSYWLKVDGIVTPSRICSSQGWFVSFGCLTTSGFLFIISVFSYLGIIRGYKATTRDVLIACACIWCASIFLASLGPMYYQEESFWGRETNWCWINATHRLWRLTVYLWGFGTMSATYALYGYMFYKLKQQNRSSRLMPWNKDPLSRSDDDDKDFDEDDRSSTRLRPSGHHPAFLIYPCIYGITGTPLMLGSVIPALENNVPFMGVCGALLGTTGLMDALLWSSILLFCKKECLAEIGLDKFAFMRTPEGRTLGNIVIVQGGSGAAGGMDDDGAFSKGHAGNRNTRGQSWHSKKDHGWWRLRDRNGSQRSFSTEQNPGQGESSGGIQMQIVTSVVVEDPTLPNPTL
ncbi:hypothetical protein BD289DRAFT_177401 [Coniella lustricola]|uniref:G protein-coupled glucose receptor regulating Gpa2-domain-containing protein n=1 Tax=Coniella lustricola TaxID=2025994 RepID=A0A2T2ZTL6_9PEZI|nr:hypothetical protein BD289DRAFT_177401 [Coniella lustricola]